MEEIVQEMKTCLSQKYLKRLSTTDNFTLDVVEQHYFKGKTFRGEKILQFSQILDKFSKVSPAKNIFVKIRESFSHAK